MSNATSASLNNPIPTTSNVMLMRNPMDFEVGLMKKTSEMVRRIKFIAVTGLTAPVPIHPLLSRLMFKYHPTKMLNASARTRKTNMMATVLNQEDKFSMD